MTTQGATHEVTRQETRGSLALWFGVLGAAAAWGAQLVINYSLEEWFACSPSAQDQGEIVGLGTGTFATIVTSVLAAIAVASLLSAIICYRKLRKVNGSDIYKRARWMAVAGIFNGVLYSAIILVSYAVPAFLDTCRSVP